MIEDTDNYIKWNRLTRHQLIVAHMTLIRELQDARIRLSAALQHKHLVPLSQLVDEAVIKIEDAANK